MLDSSKNIQITFYNHNICIFTKYTAVYGKQQLQISIEGINFDRIQ